VKNPRHFSSHGPTYKDLARFMEEGGYRRLCVMSGPHLRGLRGFCDLHRKDFYGLRRALRKRLRVLVCDCDVVEVLQGMLEAELQERIPDFGEE